MLRIRYSSPLFRLTSAEAIQHQVSFGNSGPDQVRSALRATSRVSPAFSNAVPLGAAEAVDLLAALRCAAAPTQPLACPCLNSLILLGVEHASRPCPLSTQSLTNQQRCDTAYRQASQVASNPDPKALPLCRSLA